MDKIEIINSIKKINLNKDDFWVLGSASLVLRGIINEANDIDLALTDEGFKKIKEMYDIVYLGTNNNYKWYKLNNLIEFCVDEYSEKKVDKSIPFDLLNLEYYYNNFLKNSVRDKDIAKKELIKKILMHENKIK